MGQRGGRAAAALCGGASVALAVVGLRRRAAAGARAAPQQGDPAQGEGEAPVQCAPNGQCPVAERQGEEASLLSLLHGCVDGAASIGPKPPTGWGSPGGWRRGAAPERPQAVAARLGRQLRDAQPGSYAGHYRLAVEAAARTGFAPAANLSAAGARGALCGGRGCWGARGGRPPSVYPVGFRALRPGADYSGEGLWATDAHWMRAVRGLADGVDAALGDARLHQRRGAPSLPGYEWSSLLNAAGVASVAAALGALAATVAQGMERWAYGCRVRLTGATALRSSIPTRGAPARPLSSWLWHWDNDPQEVVKVMLFLRDVVPGGGCMHVLQHNVTGEAFLSRSTKVGEASWAPPPRESRVPGRWLRRLHAAGYRERCLSGPQGSAVIFNNNVLHRGTVPHSASRDVALFQFLPQRRGAQDRHRLDPDRVVRFGPFPPRPPDA
eukprot:TRINITY_DN50246_c0_g1_i1.p1 TRINITY_DN50246_c0_g1~~TRINITY_DN50246_c0_g1_i1.p1  ORF type:complete len:440 (+),score=75.54 TRINITY_DN50246_c0_g1_i1:85-1404(+)